MKKGWCIIHIMFYFAVWILEGTHRIKKPTWQLNVTGDISVRNMEASFVD